ncbi:MAG: hypothetical protein KA799_01490 [Bacteroidales bacterium]|nr:hypothetical protein [Bacteroidales bacterium]MBP8946000.1 hypothetical protein [Bacteroidales bacterium]
MKIKSIVFMVILSIFTLIQSCSKEELKLNEDYITVSDLTRYCRCKCREISPCENKEVKIKGHIDYYTFNANFSNISYSIGGFRLKDIRNGYSIEVYFNMNDSTDKKIAIDKIISSNETDMCYIKGIVELWEMSTMFQCILEPKIILNNADDIYFDSNINY